MSLVAELNGRVIGHIAFSLPTISDGTCDWYGLGPVSVLPEHQRQGIGKALIREGLSGLKEMDAQGCCLLGHPNYHRQFGFENTWGPVLDGVPQEVFLALSLEGNVPHGTVAFQDGFKEDGQKEAGDIPKTTQFGHSTRPGDIGGHSTPITQLAALPYGPGG